MTQADRIRKFVLDHYITPASAAGQAEVTIRAGDVHKEMGLVSALPAVCSAIGSNRFSELAGVTPLERTGPANGANVYMRYRLSAHVGPRPATVQRAQPTIKPVRCSPTSGRQTSVDLRDAVVLVSCVKTKQPHAGPARSLYTSAWFTKTRDLVEATGARWFVLSALYGLVEPNVKVAPYEYTLNRLGVAHRRAWAEKVLKVLLPKLAGHRRVVIFAGSRYREFLVEPLQQHGYTVEVPMAHMARGEQLAWLSSQQ